VSGDTSRIPLPAAVIGYVEQNYLYLDEGPGLRGKKEIAGQQLE